MVNISEWLVVDSVRNEELQFDLEAEPLQIKTSSFGSSEKIVVECDIHKFGITSLVFDETVKIKVYFKNYELDLQDCEKVSLSNVPHGRDKIWTIRKTEEVMILECNDVVVGNITFAENKASACRKWSGNVEAITFPSGDNATIAYRKLPKGSFIIIKLKNILE